MVSYVIEGDLQIEKNLYDFVQTEVVPNIISILNIPSDAIWKNFAQIYQQWKPRNQALLQKRLVLQNSVDIWLRDNKEEITAEKYRAFLLAEGYIVPEGPDFQISTTRVDAEISTIAGPQLVVPVDNARYALNAANARWGSLYDAFYGTDIIPETEGYTKGDSYNQLRGEKVIQRGNLFLDQVLPLATDSWQDVVRIEVHDNRLRLRSQHSTDIDLEKPNLYVGYCRKDAFLGVLFKHHNLHIEIQVDSQDPIGKQNLAGIKDILLESAVSTIMDCEDSVAAVDGVDKTNVYRNWLGLMTGNLEETFVKKGQMITRSLNMDRGYIDKSGQEFAVSGRSLMLIRHVGTHVYSTAVLDLTGNPIEEACLDAFITILCALPDIKQKNSKRNSRTGSMYVVKPKLHGHEEVQLAVDLFADFEKLLNLEKNTIKIGIMDEERRTSVNLKECIRAARERIIFINTGFLDRTGDEIHTSMEAGVFACKADMKASLWMQTYEKRNVRIGLQCGLLGRAQIGKGMWAMPDEMQAMLDSKHEQLEAGANCAWVPSPVAATLHAIHYHKVDTMACQKHLLEQTETDDLNSLLTLGLLNREQKLSTEVVQNDLNNNVQGILGYVSRWVEQGIGCSKVPDIKNIALMEDRATLRISSQHITNWLLHGVVSEQQVMETLKKMAVIVDKQNSSDPAYQSMAPDFDNSLAFQAAMDLALHSRDIANGYTEGRLFFWRQRCKNRLGKAIKD